jgi:ATP:ADP antiporter, AAA family
MESSPSKHSNRHDAWAAGLSLFALMTGHSLLETARDALFLSSLPASQLPWAYLAIAAVALLIARANRNITARWDKRNLLAVTLAILGVGTVGFWGLFAWNSHFVPHAFYVWTGVVASVAVVQFWLLLGEVFTVTEAKRLYAAIAAGGVIGAIAGSGLSDLLLHWTDARHLILVGAGFLAAAGVLPRMCGRADEDACRGPGCASPSAGADDVDNRPRAYLKKLMAVTLLSTMALTTVDFLFKSEVARVVPAGDLGMFFARFYLALNVVALAVQLLLSPRLLRSLGANRSLLVLPVLLAFGSVGLAVAAGLAPVLLLKAADGTLRHTLHRSAIEVLYLPLSQSVRSHCKALIDAVGQRGGQALASLAILGAMFVGARPIHLAAAVAVIGIAWIVAVLGIKNLYLELFRSHLRDGAIETRIDVPELDLYSLETLVSALNSESDEEVLATLDLLDAYRKHHVIPALLLYHPSNAVVIRTLDLLVIHGRKDFASVAKRLLDHEDLEVRSAAMRALATVLPESELRSFVQEQDAPVVRAAAMVGLIARGTDGDGSLSRELEGCVGAPLEHRVAVTRAIRYQRDARFAALLERLADQAEPELQRELAIAMGALAIPALTRSLITMIANRAARGEARDALAKIGTGALPALGEALRSSSTRRKTRVHIPNTIARVHHPKSIEVLLDALPHEQDGLVRFKMIRALERLRHLVEDAKVDRVALRKMISESIERGIQMLDWSVATRRAQSQDDSLSTPGGELLHAVLLEKQNNAIDRAVRLASLLRPNEDFRLIHLGLRSRNRRLRAESVELLEAVLDPGISSGLIALVDEGPDEERLVRAIDATGYRPEHTDYSGRLRTMLLDGSEAVRCVAAYHVGELGLSELHAPLTDARPEASAYLSDIIDRALAALILPPVTGQQHAT